MKILKKQQINTQIAEARKQEIEQGLTLAKKVDTLRTELSNLQKQRLEYVEGMKAEMERQLQPLYDKKTYLQREIEVLEEVKNKLKIESGIVN